MGTQIKERWARWSARWLTRPRRIGLDLLLSAVLLFGVWSWYGCPLPRTELGQFRQMERAAMLEESRVLYTCPRIRGGKEPARLTRSVFVGQGEDWAAVGFVDRRGEYLFWEPMELDHEMFPGDESHTVPDFGYMSYTVPQSWLRLYPLERGPGIIPVAWPVPDGEGNFGWALVAAHLPPDAERGLLTLTMPTGNRQELPGRRLDSGAMLFYLPDGDIRWEENRELEFSHSVWYRVLNSDWMSGLPYTLTLSDKEGEGLTRVSGAIPAAY